MDRGLWAPPDPTDCLSHIGPGVGVKPRHLSNANTLPSPRAQELDASWSFACNTIPPGQGWERLLLPWHSPDREIVLFFEGCWAQPLKQFHLLLAEDCNFV